MSLPDAEELVRGMAEAMRGRIDKDAGLVGIFTGGAWVAERLHRALSLATPLGVLAVTLHRDDFGRIGLHRDRPQPDPRRRRPRVILVAPYAHLSTVRAAMNDLFDFGGRAPCASRAGRPRVGRELPVSPTPGAKVRCAPKRTWCLQRNAGAAAAVKRPDLKARRSSGGPDWR